MIHDRDISPQKPVRGSRDPNRFHPSHVDHFPNKYGYESKPWYPSEPQITGKWMFIPLKMVLIGIDHFPTKYKMVHILLHLCIQRHSGKKPHRRSCPHRCPPQCLVSEKTRMSPSNSPTMDHAGLTLRAKI